MKHFALAYLAAEAPFLEALLGSLCVCRVLVNGRACGEHATLPLHVCMLCGE